MRNRRSDIRILLSASEGHALGRLTLRLSFAWRSWSVTALAIMLTCVGECEENAPAVGTSESQQASNGEFGLMDVTASDGGESAAGANGLPESDPGPPEPEQTLFPDIPTEDVPKPEWDGELPEMAIEDPDADEGGSPESERESGEPDADALREEGFQLPTQRTAMQQALGTGDSILGDLGGLRAGTVRSPFLPRVIPAALPFSVGRLKIRPVLSLGISAGHNSGTGYNTSWVSGLFQGEMNAVLQSGLSSVSLSYDFGLAYPKTSRGGDQSGSGSGGGVSFDQQLSIGASIKFPEMKKVRFGFRLAFADLSGTSRDIGAATDRVLATASLTASYLYSQKTSVGLSIAVPIRQFSDGLSSSGLTSTISINKQISRKTRAGIGYSFGVLGVQNGQNQFSHQIFIDASSAPTAFLSLDASLGLEYRDAEESSPISPVFGLGATWNSQRGTWVSFAAENRIFNAASAANTNFTSTSFVLSVSQALGYKVVGSLSLGYELARYGNVGRGSGDGGRRDDLYSISFGLERPITSQWSSSLRVQAGENQSNFAPFNFWQVFFVASRSF